MLRLNLNTLIPNPITSDPTLDFPTTTRTYHFEAVSLHIYANFNGSDAESLDSKAKSSSPVSNNPCPILSQPRHPSDQIQTQHTKHHTSNPSPILSQPRHPSDTTQIQYTKRHTAPIHIIPSHKANQVGFQITTTQTSLES